MGVVARAALREEFRFCFSGPQDCRAQPTGMMATMEPTKPVVKKSAVKGNFRIASLPEGNYTVTAKKIGYKEQVLNVVVTDGETNKMKVKMEKI